MNSPERDDGDHLWISMQQNPDEETINDEEDELEVREELRKDYHHSEEESDDEECEDVSNRNGPNEGGRMLRDRRTLRVPKRYADFIDVKEVLLAEGQEPISYKEAIQSSEASKWKEAMNDEIESLQQNNVWELILPPKGQEIVDNRWTYKAKRDANGIVQRCRARLVARGFTQKHGIDYQETFSPVVRFDSLRAILAIAAQRRMKIQIRRKDCIPIRKHRRDDLYETTEGLRRRD